MRAVDIRNDSGVRNSIAAVSNGGSEAVRALGPHASRYLEFLGAQHRSLRTELSRLLALAVIYGAGPLEQTIAQALERGVIGGEHLERLLQQSESEAIHPPPLKFSDPRLIVSTKTPNLKSYDALLFDLPPSPKTPKETPEP